jgi:hypothetical protein
LPRRRCSGIGFARTGHDGGLGETLERRRGFIGRPRGRPGERAREEEIAGAFEGHCAGEEGGEGEEASAARAEERSGADTRARGDSERREGRGARGVACLGREWAGARPTRGKREGEECWASRRSWAGEREVGKEGRG